MRLKVAVVSPEVHRTGGTELCLAELIERWADRFEIHLYTMSAQGVALAETRLHLIRGVPGPHLLRYIWWYAANRAARWWQSRRTGAPDVVYSPGINCSDADLITVHIVFGKYWERVRRNLWADSLPPKPSITASHRILYFALIRLLEKVIYAGPASMAAPSRAKAREVESRFGRTTGSVSVIPHGVDPVRFSPAERARRRANSRATLGLQGESVLLLVGNDAYGKGLDTAIRALQHLPPNFVIAAAGHFDDRMVRAWAEAIGQGSRLLLWPHTTDIADYYSAADLLIAPSREDAFNLPALEGLACGLPLIVSARAGVSELLTNGRNALILPDPEDAKALAGAVIEIFDNPELAQELSVEGRAAAEQHSWSENAQRTAELIEREAATPRFLVLAQGDSAANRNAMTESLTEALASAYGADRVGFLPLWKRPPDAGLTARSLFPGWKVKLRTIGLGPPLLLGYLFLTLKSALRWRSRLLVIACDPHLAPIAWAIRLVTGAPYAVSATGRDPDGLATGLVRRSIDAADFALPAPNPEPEELAGKIDAQVLDLVAHLSRLRTDLVSNVHEP